jgi:mono/diheme cytochrome c family protein
MIVLMSALLAVSLFGACERMQEQPVDSPLEEDDFFADKRSARDLPPGAVAQEFDRVDARFYGGRVSWEDAQTDAPLPSPTPGVRSGNPFGQNPAYVRRPPIPVTMKLLRHGRDRFEQYCQPCHGYEGDGRGPVTEHGFPHPPTYHIDRLRDAPDGYLFDVITHGFGAMYSYASRLSPHDRWAVVAYVRALQRRHNTPYSELDAEARRRLSPGQVAPGPKGVQ